MKITKDIKKEHDAWFKRFQYETLKNLYKRWDAVMAGAEIGNLDLIEDKIFTPVSYTHLTLPTKRIV